MDFQQGRLKNTEERVSNGGAKGINVLKKGPYEVHGCLDLDDEVIMKLSRNEPYYLFRCGASTNKPFCDGSHMVIKFVDDKN